MAVRPMTAAHLIGLPAERWLRSLRTSLPRYHHGIKNLYTFPLRNLRPVFFFAESVKYILSRFLAKMNEPMIQSKKSFSLV